ncbi:DUF2281 domain-containing protein [Sphingobacterium faecale]|uniref:DUF2281 domain-containing protein n=1 Tax=Sphingobacterium faecale TaxID=2803775 RepID=A0ABS1R0N7_9SPHI|nr:DUF2281 domain-containing protein [Sphingobacterium faecale]MBL1408233.1 DUF2281 domain-containing protein [Sphingobacterium faecale]
MGTTTLKEVNSKLKQLPESLLDEVERYIDFLKFKYEQDTHAIPQWHKDLVLKRMEENETPVDAFGMLADIKNEE